MALSARANGGNGSYRLSDVSSKGIVLGWRSVRHAGRR